MTTDTQSQRLNRIESKIDKMSEAIIALAKVEEKIAHLEERREEQHERLNRLSGKIDNIDSHVTTLVEKVAFIQKFAWVIVGIMSTVIGATLTSIIS